MATITVVQVKKWNAASKGPDYGMRMVALDRLPAGYARVAHTERDIDASLLDPDGFAPEQMEPLPSEPLSTPPKSAGGRAPRRY
jgi:hypothetical protein